MNRQPGVSRKIQGRTRERCVWPLRKSRPMRFLDPLLPAYAVGPRRTRCSIRRRRREWSDVVTTTTARNCCCLHHEARAGPSSSLPVTYPGMESRWRRRFHTKRRHRRTAYGCPPSCSSTASEDLAPDARVFKTTSWSLVRYVHGGRHLCRGTNLFYRGNNERVVCIAVRHRLILSATRSLSFCGSRQLPADTVQRAANLNTLQRTPTSARISVQPVARYRILFMVHQYTLPLRTVENDYAAQVSLP